MVWLSFPGSAWERTVFEAPPRSCLLLSLPLAGRDLSRRSLHGSGFPGGAWEPVTMMSVYLFSLGLTKRFFSVRSIWTTIPS